VRGVRASRVCFRNYSASRRCRSVNMVPVWCEYVRRVRISTWDRALQHLGGVWCDSRRVLSKYRHTITTPTTGYGSARRQPGCKSRANTAVRARAHRTEAIYSSGRVTRSHSTPTRHTSYDSSLSVSAHSTQQDPAQRFTEMPRSTPLRPPAPPAERTPLVGAEPYVMAQHTPTMMRRL
jgi:hypothetical protein